MGAVGGLSSKAKAQPVGIRVMVKNSGRTIVIGDVHGYYEGVLRLLAIVDPRGDDRVYFLGDLIDRGPHSKQVVELVRSHRYGCVRGNHEHMMLGAFPEGRVETTAMMAWMYSGGRETLASYGNRQDLLREHVDWIRDLPLYLDLGSIWLVHAGVHPQLPLKKQSEAEFCWIRGQFHYHKKPYFKDKTIVIGHTITFTLPGIEAGQIAKGPGWLDIDTGVYTPHSGWLSALDVRNSQVYQVNVFDGGMRVLPLEKVVCPLERF